MARESCPNSCLKRSQAGQQFKSLEEAQGFVTRHAQVQNQRPREEFHGLSPEQMHRILNLPFASPELVCMPEVLATNPSAPVLTLFNLLTETTGEQGLKPTARGNLPRNFCRKAALSYWEEKAYQERTRCREYRVKALPLLGEVVQFQISR